MDFELGVGLTILAAFAAVASILALSMGRGPRLGRTRYASIDALVRDLAGRTGLVAFPGAEPREDLDGLHLVGTHGKRRRYASIRFQREGDVLARVRIAVRAPAAAQGVRVVRGVHGLEVLNRSGNPTDPDRLGRTWHSIERLFELHPIESLAVEDTLEVVALADALPTLVYAALLDALGALALAFDMPLIQLGSARALVVRCAYCHGSTDHGDGLVPCAGCATLLHAECWREHGRCPVLGCAGRAARRVPSHA